MLYRTAKLTRQGKYNTSPGKYVVYQIKINFYEINVYLCLWNLGEYNYLFIVFFFFYLKKAQHSFIFLANVNINNFYTLQP